MINITPELAEACGIHAGDGYLRNDGIRRELDLSGNVEEQDYYDNHVAPLFNNLFGSEIKNKYFKSRNTYGFVLRNKHIDIIETFHKLGFPYGKKGKVVKIPKQILLSKNKLIHARFLRGLLDTDGCLSFRKSYGKYCKFKTSKHWYPTITLTSISKKLLEETMILLDSLNIKYYYYNQIPKNPKENKRYCIDINGVERLNKWIKTIGIKNPVKYTRYLIWKKYGFCPTNTTYEQRKDILNKKISPNQAS
jgi:intein/homing endonuclease